MADSLDASPCPISIYPEGKTQLSFHVDPVGVDIQRRKAFGALLVSKRSELDLSREDLFKRTEIPVRTIGDIERGEKRIIDYALVATLANALEMSGLSREEFFMTAGVLPHPNEGVTLEIYEKREALVEQFYDTWEAYPSVVFNNLYDIHSTNSLMAAIYGSNSPHPSKSYLPPVNILIYLFDRIARDDDLSSDLLDVVYDFRIRSRRYQTSQRYHQIMEELTAFPEFNRLWRLLEEHHDMPRMMEQIDACWHPELLINHQACFQIQIPMSFSYQAKLVEEFNMWYFRPHNDYTISYLQQLSPRVGSKILRFSLPEL